MRDRAKEKEIIAAATPGCSRELEDQNYDLRQRLEAAEGDVNILRNQTHAYETVIGPEHFKRAEQAEDRVTELTAALEMALAAMTYSDERFEGLGKCEQCGNLTKHRVCPTCAIKSIVKVLQGGGDNV